jgi:hypothetical protein
MENGAEISKITWLSKKDNNKTYGLMAICVTRACDARKLLADEIFDVAGESATTSGYEHMVEAQPVLQCQELGHEAYSYKTSRGMQDVPTSPRGMAIQRSCKGCCYEPTIRGQKTRPSVAERNNRDKRVT